MTYTPSGQGFLAESEALQSAATTHMPQQVSALDGIKQLLSGRQVPGEAFGKVSQSQVAANGHKTNVQKGVNSLGDAMKRLGDWIGGVKDSDAAYKQNDQDKAKKTNEVAQGAKKAVPKTGRVSKNGWPVNPSRSMRTIPGTNVKVSVADGDAGDVLMHVADEFNKRVQPVSMHDPKTGQDDWGWNDRSIRGGHGISNHASATAIDLNATLHVQGVHDTFTPAQVDEIHKIVQETGGVVRWGGDYPPPTKIDEMHFEINADPAAVAAYAQQLRDAAARQQQ
jgi:hypothetical protein